MQRGRAALYAGHKAASRWLYLALIGRLLMNQNLLMLRDRIAAILDVLASGRIATGVRMLREMLADISAALEKGK